MRIAEYKQVSTRTEQRVIHHDAIWDDNGNVVANAWDETVEVQVPVMDLVHRDATPEERLDALETTTDDMILLMADLIGGV